MGKRENNKSSIRKGLLEEARRLFSTKGYEHTTVADIVTRCGIGRGTFYNYYADVKDIFNAVIVQKTIDVQMVIQEARQDCTTIYDFLYTSFLSYFDFVSQDEMIEFHRKNQAYIRSISYGSNSILRLTEDLQQELKKLPDFQKFDDDVHLQMLGHVIVGTASELFLNIQDTGLAVSNEQMATFLARLFTEGLAEK